MNIIVASRSTVKNVVWNMRSSTIVISIIDPNKDSVFHKEDMETIPYLCDCLTISFWDEIEDKHGCMSYQQAKSILDFVIQNPFVKNIVVHCEAGISRSAGVAAALAKIINGNDDYFFDYYHNRYVPNMTCYKRILEVYYNK